MKNNECQLKKFSFVTSTIDVVSCFDVHQVLMMIICKYGAANDSSWSGTLILFESSLTGGDEEITVNNKQES